MTLTCSNITQSHSVNDDTLQNVLENLLVWLNDQNYFDYQSFSAPYIQIVNSKKMCLVAYGESSIHENQADKCADILGLYDFENSTIYISHNLDLSSKEGQAIIVHELVHHFQYKSGEADKVVNINELEPLAYFLERKFSKQNSLLVSNRHFY